MKMNMRKNRFWTLSRQAGGFTLVELIVVIAILAILAGVAVPVYSGYIKRANRVADEQLLATINQAFASACLQNGIIISSLDFTTAKMPLTNEGKVDVANVKPATIADAFAQFYAGNENSAFKQITGLVYIQTAGMFRDANESAVQVQYGNTIITVSPAYLDALKASGFITYDGLGTATLVGKLQSVTDLATNIFGSSETEGAGADLLNGVLADDGFQKYAAQAVGIDTTGMNKSDIEAALFSKMEEMVGEDGDQNAFLANAAVLYASKEAASMNSDDVLALLTSGNVKGTILGNIENNTSDAFAQATLAYGMYTSFAHSEYGSEEAKSKDEFAAMNDLDNPAFIAYMQSEAGKADLEGYMAALNIINSSANNEDAVSKLLTNGFGDPDLITAIDSALGVN